jgi:hypothetical protein
MLIKSVKDTRIWRDFVRLGGLEPPTLCLKGRCSTTELQPLPK